MMDIPRDKNYPERRGPVQCVWRTRHWNVQSVLDMRSKRLASGRTSVWSVVRAGGLWSPDSAESSRHLLHESMCIR